MSTPPPYRMTPGPARQEDRDRLAADLAFWPQARPALRPHVEALITVLQHGDCAEIVTLTGDDRLLAALHLVREPLLVDWAMPTRTEHSLMLCHLVKSPDAPAGEPVLRLVTMWATDFAARLGRQWIRGEVPLSPGSPANGLLALAKDTGWGHEKTVSVPSGEVALVQCRAEPRPHLDLFLHCQVPILPVPAGPTAVRP